MTMASSGSSAPWELTLTLEGQAVLQLEDWLEVVEDPRKLN